MSAPVTRKRALPDAGDLVCAALAAAALAVQVLCAVGYLHLLGGGA